MCVCLLFPIKLKDFKRTSLSSNTHSEQVNKNLCLQFWRTLVDTSFEKNSRFQHLSIMKYLQSTRWCNHYGSLGMLHNCCCSSFSFAYFSFYCFFSFFSIVRNLFLFLPLDIRTNQRRHCFSYPSTK